MFVTASITINSCSDSLVSQVGDMERQLSPTPPKPVYLRLACPIQQFMIQLSTSCSGRKLAGLAYCFTYGASCVTKHFSNYWILMLGRFFGGIATSLLFSTFESWLVAEHTKVLSNSPQHPESQMLPCCCYRVESDRLLFMLCHSVACSHWFSRRHCYTGPCFKV